ncbi:MAG: class I SAM-dependent methyltransferase [Burkholderiales bacterium]|nr:class I SAM-dependent methyltransferase [Burkholderiales bacterium]
MILERSIDHALLGLRARADIPLRLRLWDNREHDLGRAPKVTVLIPTRRALMPFIKPSLDRLADAYIQGMFHIEGRISDAIDAVAGLVAATTRPGRARRAFHAVRANKRRDAEAIGYHYDVSNDFYAAWLDARMVYSCAYFETGREDLETAQLAKLDHILTKIMVQPGDRLLDIGCGWGALAIRAAQKYGARVTGITLSKNQYELARERVRAAGVADRVEIRLQDYRDVTGTFERITSVGMFEHVGLKNLRTYFGRIQALLADGGLAMNHGITATDPESRGSPYGAADFIDKYVFPRGELPHISLALKEMAAAGLEALDVESLRRHYARTLALWSANFEDRAAAIHRLVDEKRFRIWRIYLAGCAHAFAHDWVSIHQVLVCKAGADPRYNSTPWSRRYMYP